MGDVIKFGRENKPASKLKKVAGTKAFNTDYVMGYRDLLTMHNYYKLVKVNVGILGRVNKCITYNLNEGALLPTIPQDLSYLFISEVNPSFALIQSTVKSAIAGNTSIEV